MSVPTEIRCPTCGRASNTADRYCGFCGSRLDADAATPTDEITGSHRPHVDRILTALRAATIGEYDVAGEIGRGGMAVVFLAHDLSLNRKVAIKALLPELLYTEGMDRRFKHEARIAAKLDHPNILVIHAVREANDLLFIVMKLVEGLPLSTIVKVAGPLPIPVVRFVVRYVADALAYAHGEGVIHRDVKPANVMVDRRGNVIVMDFGIAKAADDAHLTRTGLVIGTPAYMSPEQCLAQGVSAASDQYSLGVVAYELLTGRTPFRGSPLEMQWAHATAGAPSVRSVRPDCPPELDALVMRMLAKAPADRWPSLHDVSHALADDPATAAAARAALVTLASEAPGRRDATMPTTPASPVPIGPGPAAAGDATTDPVRRPASSATAGVSSHSAAPNAAPAVAPMLTLSQQRIELSTGASVELIVELEADDEPSDGSTVAWESSNPAVAEVSRDGFVTAVAPGLAEIACAWRGRRAVCVVHVTAAAPAIASARPAAPRQDANIPDAIPALVPAMVAPVATRPEFRAHTAPTIPASLHKPRVRWWIGSLAVGAVGAAVYLVARPEPGTTVATNAAASPSAVTAERPVPQSAPTSVAPPRVAPTLVATDSAKTAGAPASATTPNADGVRSKAPPAPVLPKARSTPPPTVPLARPDSARLTPSRTDTGAGYSASRSAAQPATPPNPAPGYSAPPVARDSSTDRIPPPSRDVASALFKEFANTINSRTYTRIIAAYSQPSDAAEVKVWQEFLLFVRDYRPRATMRSTSVDESTNPPTITANLDFRWATDAGFERTRTATFVGIGIPIPGGWQLRGVRMTKKFW